MEFYKIALMKTMFFIIFYWVFIEPTVENLREWFDAGAACVGIGSNLITKELIQKKDWDGMAAKVADTLKIVKSVRKSWSPEANAICLSNLPYSPGAL